MQISQITKMGRNDHLVILADKNTDWKKLERPEDDIDLIKSQLKKDIRQIVIAGPSQILSVVILEAKDTTVKTDEEIRKAGNKILFRDEHCRDERVTSRRFFPHRGSHRPG